MRNLLWTLEVALLLVLVMGTLTLASCTPGKPRSLEQVGGLRVVLQIPNRAEFIYTLTPPLTGALEAEKKQQQL